MQTKTHVKLKELADNLGCQHVINLITGCDRFAQLLNGIPIEDRARLRVWLDNVIALEADELPQEALFLLETIAKGMDAETGRHCPPPEGGQETH